MVHAKKFFNKSSALLPESIKQRLKRKLGVPGVQDSLLRMRKNGFLPKTVIDVGAFRGEWTRMCRDIFPEAHVLMVEPQHDKLAVLNQLMAELQGVTMVSALLGQNNQEQVGFYENGSASSVLGEHDETRRPASFMQMRTLSEITDGTGFSSPDLIKLDVQGYELNVLKGGEDVLASTESVLMEVNLIDIYEGAPLMHEVVDYMSNRGFRVYDICTFFRRPLDDALWQVDMIFVKESSPLLASKSWA